MYTDPKHSLIAFIKYSGSQQYKPSIDTFNETNIIKKIYELIGGDIQTEKIKVEFSNIELRILADQQTQLFSSPQYEQSQQKIRQNMNNQVNDQSINQIKRIFVQWERINKTEQKRIQNFIKYMIQQSEGKFVFLAKREEKSQRQSPNNTEVQNKFIAKQDQKQKKGTRDVQQKSSKIVKQKPQEQQSHKQQRQIQKYDQCQSPQLNQLLQVNQSSKIITTKSFNFDSNIPEKFDNKIKGYLFDYYKHFCEQNHNYPKGRTFQDLRELYETMSLTQWMQFCIHGNLVVKNTDLSSSHQSNARGQFKKKQQISITILKSIFNKNEQKNCHYMTFDGFCKAIRELMIIIEGNNQKEGYLTIPVDPYDVLGLVDDECHFRVMDTMGVKYIREKVYFCNLSRNKVDKQQLNGHLINRSRLIVNKNYTDQNYKPTSQCKYSKFIKTVDRKSYHTGNKNNLENQSVDQKYDRNQISEGNHTLFQSNYNKTYLKDKDNVKTKMSSKNKKQIKFYKTREQRKQSELLKKLNINNLSQFHPTYQTLESISNAGMLAKQDDYYLKQYQKQQELNQSKVISRMDAKANKVLTRIR